MNFCSQIIYAVWTLVVTFVLFLSSIASATTWYVDAAAGSNGNGSDQFPFNNLQSALTNGSLTDGDTIIIAQGVYKPGSNRTDSFVISSYNLILQGGWINNGGGNWEFSPATATTILSGDIDNDNVLDADNSYTVLKLSYADAVPSGPIRTVIEHLTITGGYANGGAGQFAGGGVRITAGAPRLHNVIIANNRANTLGGGVHVNSAKPVFTLCTIEHNTTLGQGCNFDGEGGGIYVEGTTSSGEMKLIDCKIQNNGAVNGNSGPAQGAGIAIHYGGSHPTRVDLVNCLIAGNRGGPANGIFEEQGPSCPTGAEGGGILIHPLEPGTIVNIINCTIVNNFASIGGGIYMHNLPNVQGTPTSLMRLRNSILWNNEAAWTLVMNTFRRTPMATRERTGSTPIIPTSAITTSPPLSSSATFLTRQLPRTPTLVMMSADRMRGHTIPCSSTSRAIGTCSATRHASTLEIPQLPLFLLTSSTSMEMGTIQPSPHPIWTSSRAS